MKTMIRAAWACVLIGTAVAAHAQTASHPLTRAEVRQELADMQAAGYRPGIISSPDYPQNMQAIVKQVAQAHAATGYGSNGNVATESGKPGQVPTIDRNTYAHH
ncbi:DUF4148 domain-containing protein [Burkholderia sp. Ac-20353]|uniref:DUF4148 domain-containing protein n=1 Tax=Burkholderia sp. Ac-20353 TaxID=2703894 RepID=UPI00197C1F2A|nr:DUF4148 domain-containing protein [Burkholderia sp. Ac-20353]MBN3792930.1 DUF4148 domain-containing protein [Burkholderia sp. Ac-20353]